MLVLVLLTGEVNGLSGPISFDSIETEIERVTISGLSGVRTKLEVAVDFIMCLEKRETAAFGPQPDLVASTTNEPHPEEYYGSLYEAETYSAREMGWRYGPIVGPSSKWVSMKSYPEWTGTSAREDMKQNGGDFMSALVPVVQPSRPSRPKKYPSVQKLNDDKADREKEQLNDHPAAMIFSRDVESTRTKMLDTAPDTIEAGAVENQVVLTLLKKNQSN
ncbi:hypothetical protein FCULG_00000070 [Fusarium culmorum]|uniref:Uncharacterized protein n=1 Tax=Fusarium culmorum TaxID=5516 RepID=A0A2T4GR23_FUSCU|nr:hypothetical protein FCULG_00000070 [Fusarium culmorum]